MRTSGLACPENNKDKESVDKKRSLNRDVYAKNILNNIVRLYLDVYHIVEIC